MNSYLSTPTTILISATLLVGWIIGDFQFRFVVDAAYAQVNNMVVMKPSKIDLSENGTTPDIATNWFTGSSASMSSQLPLAQTRKSDEDEHIAQGRLVGESFGNDKP